MPTAMPELHPGHALQTGGREAGSKSPRQQKKGTGNGHDVDAVAHDAQGPDRGDEDPRHRDERSRPGQDAQRRGHGLLIEIRHPLRAQEDGGSHRGARHQAYSQGGGDDAFRPGRISPGAGFHHVAHDPSLQAETADPIQGRHQSPGQRVERQDVQSVEQGDHPDEGASGDPRYFTQEGDRGAACEILDILLGFG